MERFPLDEETISIVAEIKQKQEPFAQQWNILEAQKQGALTLFFRQHKLVGNWRLDPNGLELIQDEQPQPQPTAPPQE